MSVQPETTLVQNIKRAILGQWPHAWVEKIHGSPYQTAGIPDLLVVVRGRLFAFEVKAQRVGETEQHARGRASTLQLNQIYRLRQAGAYADVILSPAEALDAIRRAIPKKVLAGVDKSSQQE